MQIEELKGSLAEVEKQVDGELGAHAALWEKLQQANERLSASATEALGKENEFERRLGMSDYRRQCSEAQLREALSSLKVKALHTYSASQMQHCLIQLQVFLATMTTCRRLHKACKCVDTQCSTDATVWSFCDLITITIIFWRGMHPFAKS